MNSVVVEIDKINLPPILAKKMKSKKVKLSETDDGILMTAIENPINTARGILKGTRFNTNSYLKFKKQDKELEK